MRRLLGLLGVSTMLLCASWLGAHAQIAIAGDAKGGEMFMDVALRDADLSEALTALFSTTNGKYQLNIGAGVVGRVARLQLTQTPFERALDAILGPDFSYTKQQLGTGSYLYRISGRKSGDASPSAPRGEGATFAPPTSSVDSGKTTSSTGGSSPSSTLSFLQSPRSPAGGGGVTAGGSAAAESAYIRLILVANLDLESLSSTLGGTSIVLFDQTSSGSGSSSTTRSTSTRSTSSQNYNTSTNTDAATRAAEREAARAAAQAAREARRNQ